MIRRRAALALLVALGLAALAEPGAVADDKTVLRGEGSTGEKKVVLLELYSSQGCSSCPPAEEFVSGLPAKGYPRDRVVTAAFHVDYWDKLGWKDPFAQKAWTKRQTELDTALRLTNIYTPQLVLDGADAGAAGDPRALDRALGAPPRARLTLEAELAEKLSVKGTVAPLGEALPAGLAVEVLLLEDDLSTKCERGENRGRTLDETSVVRALARPLTLARPAKERTSFEAKLDVPAAARRDKLHVAAVLRDPKTWRVHQALDVALVRS